MQIDSTERPRRRNSALGRALASLGIIALAGLLACTGCTPEPGTGEHGPGTDTGTSTDAGVSTDTGTSTEPNNTSPDSGGADQTDSGPAAPHSDSDLAYPPTFEIDTSVEPSRSELPAHSGENNGPRPVARLADSLGNEVDFVSNELVVASDNRQKVEALANRWDGEIVETLKFDDSALDQLENRYTVRIDPTGVDLRNIGKKVLRIDRKERGAHRLSSAQGLLLFAVAIRETLQSDLEPQLNWIPEGATIARGHTEEAPESAADPDEYDSDAAKWPYMEENLTQNIRVMDAWRALERTGQLSNSVNVAIVDGGFTRQSDLPNDYRMVNQDAWGERNPIGCGDGNPCPWHGTNVSYALAGVPDNEEGVAGPGGPVSDIAVATLPQGDVTDMLEFAERAVDSFASQRPAVLNISAGGDVPALGANFARKDVENLGNALRAVGTLPVTSAGNDGENVDAEDCRARVCAFGKCIGTCWEESSTLPCEADAFMCVGGLSWNAESKDPHSNYGEHDSNSVDIYAPYEVYTGPAPNHNGVQRSSGTSFSSPFVAGIAALVKSADPSLGPDEIQNILEETAHDGNDEVNRIVNAFGAVTRVLGDTPPYAEITSPDAGSRHRFGHSISISGITDDFEDSESQLDVEWRSDIDGTLNCCRAQLSPGRHEITLEVTDSNGQTDTDSMFITVTNADPEVEILSPKPDGMAYEKGRSFRFLARTEDPDLNQEGNKAVDDKNVFWTSNLEGRLGTGHAVTASLDTVGTHVITVRATDGHANTTSTFSMTVEIAKNISNRAPTSPEVSVLRGTYVNSVSDTLISLRSLAQFEVDVRARTKDPEGKPLTYTWEGTGSWKVVNSGSGGAKTTLRIDPSSATGGGLKLTVSDGKRSAIWRDQWYLFVDGG